MSPRNVFIVNPKAGKHDSTQFITDAASRVLSGIPYEIAVTERPGHAADIAAALCAGGEDTRIYSCGGDGTLNEIVNGVYRSGCPDNVAVGCVPTGSGNDFIKYFNGMTFADFLDISRQVSGAPVRIDLLEVNGRAAINIISCGYDAAVCDHMANFKKLPLVGGSAAYNMSVVWCLIAYMKNRYKLYADGVQVDDKNHDYLFAIAANGRYYGGGFKAAPTASFDDGLMDFIRIPTVSRLQFAKLVGIFRRGEHLEKLPFCRLVRCKTMKVASEKPVNVNIDGEIVKMSDPEIRILPAKLNFIIPNKNGTTER